MSGPAAAPRAAAGTPRAALAGIALVIAFLAPLAPGAVPPALAADYDAAASAPRLRFDLAPSYRSWDLDDSTATAHASQYFLPITMTAPLGKRIDLVAGTAIARTSFEDAGGAEGTLSGLTDLGVKAFWKPTPSAFLALGVNLPVGNGALATDAAEGEVSELTVAQVMGSPILGFRAKRMGEGFDFEAGAGWAAALSANATLGLGAGYVAKGQYDLLASGDATTAFTPGGEGSLSAGIDLRPDERTLLRFDVAGRFFGDDEQEGDAIYGTGNQFEFDALAARRQPSWWGSLSGRVVTKSDDEQLSGAADSVRVPVPTSGLTSVAAQLAFRVATAVALGAEASYASFGESTAPVSDGTTFAVGPALHWTPSGSAGGATLRALYLTGSAADGDLDLSGLDLSATLAVGF